MLFYSFFRTLLGAEVTVELTNGLVLHGTLSAVDQFLNIKLRGIKVENVDRYPFLKSATNCFIRSSNIRDIILPSSTSTDMLHETDSSYKTDTALLQDASRVRRN